jgi:hypothetical protein
MPAAKEISETQGPILDDFGVENAPELRGLRFGVSLGFGTLAFGISTALGISGMA